MDLAAVMAVGFKLVLTATATGAEAVQGILDEATAASDASTAAGVRDRSVR